MIKQTLHKIQDYDKSDGKKIQNAWHYDMMNAYRWRNQRYNTLLLQKSCQILP